MPEPTPINRMTLIGYDQERRHIQEVYGDSSRQAGGKRDQAIAKLFYKSGWTQQELADKESKSNSWVSYRLRFGAFLDFSTTVESANKACAHVSERAFRNFWAKTGKGDNDRQRFLHVLRQMEKGTVHAPSRPKIGKAIVAKCCDDKWHRLGTIAERVEASEEHIADTLDVMTRSKGSYGAKATKKRVGKHDEYRISLQDINLRASEMTERLRPIIKGLNTESKKHSAHMSSLIIARFARDLERLLEEWTQKAS